LFYKLPDRLAFEIDELEYEIQEAAAGRLTPEELKNRHVPFGVYEQRKKGTYMMRVRCPGGAVTPAQLRAVALCAREADAGQLHITTRQELQLHGLPLTDLAPTMRKLMDAGLSTRGNGGNTVRNIVAPPSSGADPGDVFDVSPFVFALTSRLLADLESLLLPRKLKIAFSTTGDDEALAVFHDIGFVASVRDGRQGFVVYLAGGLGAKPSAGRCVHEFLPLGETVIVTEAVKRLFIQHGDRKNRNRNRLRFLRESMGDQEFLDLYRRFEAEVRASGPAPLEWESIPVEHCRSLPTSPDLQPDLRSDAYEVWKRRYVRPHRHPRFGQVIVPVMHGLLPVDHAVLLADFLEPFGPDILRGTREQNLLLRHIPEMHLGLVYEFLRSWNPLTDSAPFLGRMVVCTGAATCRPGICMTRPAVDAVVRHLKEAGLPLDDLDNVRLNISGCPNSCSNHWAADLGFFGKAARKGGHFYPAYNVIAGGRMNAGDAGLAKHIGVIPAGNLPGFIGDFIGSYIGGKSPHDSFRAYLEAGGDDDLRALCVKHGHIPDYGENPGLYRDWGANEPFSPGGRTGALEGK
jgi:sulfite reductase (ferredoxin)